MNYYNENEPFAAQWLVNLVGAGHIPFGQVDSRSILDVHQTARALMFEVLETKR